MKDFSLKDSAAFLPISKSRRQFSLDSSLTSRGGQCHGVQVQGSNEVARFTRELKAIKARGLPNR
jgi:hypothetical protein